jgi:ketosteroid isomerase-like protein
VGQSLESLLAAWGSEKIMSDKDLYLEYVKAYNSKDVSRMISYFGEGCVFENISGGKATVRTKGKGKGKAELEALARKSTDAFASREQRVVTITHGQGRAVAEIEYHAVLQADLTPGLKAGTHLHLRCVSVAEFSGGKIIRLSDYS